MSGVAGMPRHAARVTIGRYLGYTLVANGERSIDVFRLDGRLIGTAYSFSGARRIVRQYRSGSKR